MKKRISSLLFLLTLTISVIAQDGTEISVGTEGEGTIQQSIQVVGDGTYTGTWSDVSDVQFKKDIVDVTNSLEKVKALKVKKYKMKNLLMNIVMNCFGK